MNQLDTQQKGRVEGHGAFQNRQAHYSGDVITQFLDAMAAAGIAPADTRVIVGDGLLHRFKVAGDKQGTKNGFYIIHLEGIPAGHFGSWKHGVSQSWCSKSRDKITHAEREDMRRRMEAARAASRAKIEQEQSKAADKAAHIWSQAKPAPADHPYLANKRVQPFGARCRGGVLVLPIIDGEGRLRSLQFIDGTGSKRFLTGGQKKACFILVSSPERAKKIVIAEGFATGATLSENMPDATVFAALDAGNLQPVAEAIRQKYPDAELIIACDFDAIGQEKGHAAARAAAALVLPTPANVPTWVTDWNDFAALVSGGAQ